MSQEDSLYEIATTDAWRALLALIHKAQGKFEKDVISVVKRTDFSPIEAARYSGRVEAMEFLSEKLRGIERKVKQDGD